MHGRLGCRAESTWPTRNLRLIQRLLYVLDYVVGVFDAQGEPYQVLAYPEARPAGWGELPVRGRRRVYSKGVDVAEARGHHAEPERVQEAERRFATTIGSVCGELEGDETAGVGQQAAGDLAVRMILRARIVYLHHLRVGGEADGDFSRILALALYP